jgi:CRISPR type IV-associated protein Csf3
MYKITFDMRSPIIFTELPTLDGLLSYCFAREYVKDFVQKTNLTKEDIAFLDSMPLRKFPNGAFVASWMQFGEGRNAEYITSLKKRWANEYDSIANFAKGKRKVETDRGEYKSYQIPFQLNNIEQVWFYFDTDDLKHVNKLLLNHLVGIGKKISAGYGEFREWRIEAIDNNPFESKVLRPMPNANNEGVFMGWKPPYWAAENMAFCTI